jgi:drug/metabolite transporter (DMT)-like permease
MRVSTSTPLRAAVALALAALLWSGNFIAGRALRDDIDPVTLNLLRWSLALLFFLPWAGLRLWRCRAVVRREWPLLLALGATGIAAFHTLVYLALNSTTAVNAMLMLSLTPAAILLGAALTGGQTPTRRQWAGTALSLAGAALLITRGDVSLLQGLDATHGDRWMLLAVVLWAMYSLLLRRRPAELPNDVALAASIVPALLLLLPLALLTAPAQAIEATPRLLGMLVYVALFASLLAFLLWSWGVGQIGPERAGPYVHLIPVFGAGLSVPLLGESLVATQLAGAALVAAGLLLVQQRPPRAARNGPAAVPSPR